MSESPVRSLPAGSMLAHYRIQEPVGEGAMGTVYRAHDEGLDRTVAVKVLRPGASGVTVRVDRFFREARAAARINHPNLTHVYYVGGEGSYRFFAMEYVTGVSLEEYAARGQPPDLETALDLLVQAADGLAAAHAAGVVHRDIKPSNILVCPDGTVKITDFGLSKTLEADVNASQDGTVTGTPTFMSPEQCRGTKVDPRSDVYALGLTAWALLVGRAPYPGSSLGQIIHDQLNTPLPPLCAQRPDLPRSLEQVLQRMCAKDPAKRPQTMGEVVRLLEDCRPQAVHPASLVARGVAVVVDGVLAEVAWAAIAFPLHRLGGFAFDTPLELVVPAFLFLALTLTLEIRYGQTVGKWFLHLRVRNADGTPPSRRRLLGRLLVRFPGLGVWAVGLPTLHGLLALGANVLTLGAVAAGVGCFYAARGRTLSDLLTRTRVVYVMPADERRPQRVRRKAAPARKA